jgi:hypothetical protein
MTYYTRLKGYILCGLLLLFTIGLSATFIRPDQALTIARNWMLHNQPGSSYQLEKMNSFTDDALNPQSLRADFIENDLPELYLIHFANGAFTLVSADNNMPPVLAYSSNPSDDLNDMPPAFLMWLEYYAQNTRYIREKSIVNPDNQALWQDYSRNVFSGHSRSRDISPLIETNWNQDWPYNELCPQDSSGPGGRVYAGCVATAMAQVMKYWNKPITGEGNSSYYAYGYGYQSVNYGNTTYLWDEMPNAISTSNIPVATLIYHAAVGVEMGFSPEGSGSNGMKARNAFQNYFRYPNANYVQKQNYSSGTWLNMLREQLNNGSPMYYSGSNTSSGHAWNCDGYQGTDYIHFNFGWGGSYNGYFYLDDITPGTSEFNLYQAAVINTIPENYSITDPRIQLKANNGEAGDDLTLRLTSYPVLADWGVNNVSLSLYYENSSMQYLDYDLSDTMSEGGIMEVTNNPDTGYLNISWTGTTPLSGAGDLFRFHFRALNPGNFYFGQVDMSYNGQLLQYVDPVIIDVTAPVATLAESSISLNNIVHLGYEQLGTMIMSSTYLPPAWDVNHVEYKLSFDDSKIELVDIIGEECLLEGYENVTFSPVEPGVYQITCDTEQALGGAKLPLMKLSFRAIGNTDTIEMAQVIISDFHYNQTQITDIQNGYVFLSPISANEDQISPLGFTLNSYPNPFNPTTTIYLNNPEAQNVDAAIYNLKGQRVYDLHKGYLDSGEHHIVWNGQDQNGNSVGTGVYLLRVRVKDATFSKKLSLIK